jgi:outer membrane protein assembly factor BamB
MSGRKMMWCGTVLGVWLYSASAQAQQEWPQFRGPGSRGVAEGAALPDTWSATENVAWKTELPGRGWSSPIVTGNRVFVTTAVAEGELEAPKKGLYFGGDRSTPPDAVQLRKVLCLDLDTGAVLWEKQVHAGKPTTAIHIKNSYASETPATDGERVFCYFGDVGVFCFDLEGNPLWHVAVDPHPTRAGWGTASSPIVHEGRVYVVNDNEEDSYLLALDAQTGAEVWRVARDEKSNWSTPFIWKNAQRTEIVTPGSGQVRSYDLSGKLLWSLTGMSRITIATPYESDGLLYVTSGFTMDPQRPAYAILPGASGDISLSEDQSSNEWIVWQQPQAAPYNPSTLVYDGQFYVLQDRGTLAAYDAKEGTEIYGAKRIPKGGAFTASPWAYNGMLFCINEDGVTSVIKAGPTFEVLRTNALEPDEMCLATPAIAGNKLLIRTATRLYCIASKPSKP